MNFPGPINSNLASASAISLESEHFTFVPHPQSDAGHTSAYGIVVPDKYLLFHGDYAREGSDLILSAQDQKYVVHDYFKGEKRPALLSEDGAMLSGHIVSSLTGHVQYAQATPADAVQVIGHVMKLSGSASVIRNGVTVDLNVGDAVQKGDVIQTGSDSSIAMTLIDGSAFGMTSNARMVLNEMIYDPNGSSNSAFISLVQGTVTFVAGQTAKNGNMRVETPVATMGIRGTAVLVKIYADTGVVETSLGVEPDGHVGGFAFYDNVTGALLGTVTQAGRVTIISPNGVGQAATATEQAQTQQAAQGDKALFSQVFQLYFPNYNPDANPKSTDHPRTDIGVPPTVLGKSGTDPDSGRPTITYTVQVTNPDTHVTTDLKIVYVNTPPIFLVTNAQDVQAVALGAHSFKLGDHVTITDPDIGAAPFFDVAIPYVTNSGTLIGATTTSPAPNSYLLNSSLVSLDPATGIVTYNPEGFRFLGAGETAVYKFTFVSASGVGGSGSDQGFETLYLTITGENDSPVFTQTNTPISFKETADVMNDSTPHLYSSIALAFTDEDFSDVASVFHLTKAVSTNITGTHATTPDISKLPDSATLLSYLTIDNTVDPGAGVSRTALTDQGIVTAKFSAPDKVFDFLAEGEQIQIVYTIQIDDGHAGSTPSTETLTFTVTGTNDTPVLVADADSHALTETTDATLIGGVSTLAVSGSLDFTDVDLTDTHSTTSPTTVASAVWAKPDTTSAGTIPTATLTALAAALTTSLSGDSSNGSTGHVAWGFKLPDGLADFLAQGETLTVTYNVSVSDGHTDAGIATQPVTIVITGTNDLPVAVADSDLNHVVEAGNNVDDTVFAGTPLTSGNVLTNDTDVDINDTHTVVGVAVGNTGGTLTGNVGTSINGTYGSLVLNSNGTWTYTLDNNKLATDALAQNAHATDVFTYTESDNHGGTSTTTLTVGITGTNDAPITNHAPGATPDTNTTPVVEQGVHPGNTAFAGTSSATGNVLANDTDVDTGDTQAVQGVAAGTSAIPLTAGVGAVILGIYGSVTVATNGDWTYTLNNSDADTQALKQGETASDVFTYTMRDSAGATSSATLTIDLTGTNDAPTVANAPAATTGSVTEDAALTATAQLSANDVDHGATQTWSVVGSDTGTYGAIAVDTAGNWTYTLDNETDGTASAVQSLAAGEQHNEQFTVRVTDDQGAYVDQTVSVTVHGTNDAPVVDTATLVAVNEDTLDPAGATVATLFTGKFHDIDNGSSLKGVAVIANNATTDQGVWQYKTPTSGVWEDVGTPDAQHALIFSTDTDLRFVPTADYNGTPGSLSVYGLDDTYDDEFTSGTAQPGGQYTYDTTNHGGSTPISAAAVDIGTSITPVNDAPVAISLTATLAAIDEDTLNPPGDTISNLFAANFSDAKDAVPGGSAANTFAGVAITSYAPDAAKGDWEYSIDGGSSWVTLGTVTFAAAVTLGSSDMLHFVPAHDYNGAATALSANLIESGETIVSGATIVLSAVGGSTHFSQDQIALGETINPVNDAPVLAVGTPQLTAIADTDVSNAGQTVASFLTGVSDVDTGAVQGIAVTATNDGNGSWQYSLNGTDWSSLNVNGSGVALLLTPNDYVRFVPNGTAATSASLTYHAWDQTQGTDGGIWDLSSGPGGSTAFSVATQTATIDVTGPNAAPVVSISGDTAPTFTTYDYAGANATYASGINDAGQLVGAADLPSGHQTGWEYTDGVFSAIYISGDTTATSINDSGVVSGYYSPVPSTPRYGFTDTTATTIDLTPNVSTTIIGNNDDGVVVGASYLHDGTVYKAFVDDHGSMTYFSVPGTETSTGYTDANDINNVGQIVGSFTATYGSNWQSYLYQGGQFTTISDPDAVQGTFAHGINDEGQIVGWYVDANGISHGFIDNNGTFITIDSPLGVNGTAFQGINNDGQIVGFYTDGNHVQHGFVASLNATAEDTPLTMHGVSISDADAGSSPIQVSLSVAHGSLSLEDTTGLTTNGLGTGTVSLTGSQADIDAALGHGLTYAPGLHYSGSDVLNVTATDNLGAQSSTEQISLTINPVNDAPVLNADNVSPEKIGDGGITHPDGTTQVFGITLTDAGAHGNLTISAVAQYGSLTDSNGDALPTSGTVADINNLFTNGVIYTPTSASPDDIDHLTLTVGHGQSDTLTFVFHQEGTGSATLTGTEGKDIIFASGNGDTLTGLGGDDNFVFAPHTGAVNTVSDFQSGQDQIVLNGFSSTLIPSDNASFTAWLSTHASGTTNALIDLNNAGDPGPHETITLTGVAAANLHANDFIIHPGSSSFT